MKVTRRALLVSSAAAAAPPPPGAAPAGLAPGRKFTGAALREIAFPLGGIGTGTVSLGGGGQFRDWEIFNRPAKGGDLPFTFVAARFAGAGLKKPVVRVLARQPLPPFTGGSGVGRVTGLGLPHFRSASFAGAYPFAELRLSDAAVPVTVTLEAFNPMK